MLLLFLLSIVIGVIVGLTGMGGILAIPAIILLAKASPHAAMATALASFLLTGVIGTLNFRAMGVLERKNWMPLCLGGLPFTFAGAWLNACFPASLLLFLLGCIIILAGVSALHAWRAFSGINVNASPRRSLIIAAVGAGAGLAAGLTGAGGPRAVHSPADRPGHARLSRRGHGHALPDCHIRGGVGGESAARAYRLFPSAPGGHSHRAGAGCGQPASRLTSPRIF